MKYITHNQDPHINVNHTHLQGYVDATFDQLTALFGAPGEGDGYKVDAEWLIQFEDGTVATVYNYKTGRNYCGKHGTPVERMESWHVGGFTKDAAVRVQQAVNATNKGD